MAAEDLIPTLQTAIGTFNTIVDGKQSTINSKVSSGATASNNAITALNGAQTARDTADQSLKAAYRDLYSAKANVEHQNLAALAASKAVTAVDVFVYDTSKDSDGGAWRKRCSKLSWFNEPLNTATRGARREFPAVAVIVLEAGKLTVYDGDDPALPMWMMFNDSGGTILRLLGGGSSAKCLNGKMAVGSTINGLQLVDFIADNAHRYNPQLSAVLGNISQRNYNLPTQVLSGSIADALINDVAMTVLPGAPVDPATGLPVPTIAVATEAGVLVIRQDGTVARSGSTQQIGVVDFDDIGVWYGRRVGAFTLHFATYAQIAAGSGFGAFVASDIVGQSLFNLLTRSNELATARSMFALAGGQSNNGAVSGLMLHRPEYSNHSRGISVLITSGFSTGWMPGTIRGAFLADTDDADLVGNGTLTAPDRSIASKPLLVVGTITRAPVAAGAELVAYSGFSVDNYLEGTHASYVDTLYALGWVQTAGVWEFKHGVVSAAPIDGLTITGTTLRIAGTKPKALVRVTATVPTAAQLAKIEADERFLFQENAACTLYGASDAVTALAHDPDTGLLHVGTSAGRSVFKGLRRVSNTTTAVGTAISAVNGMVVEE